MVDLKEEKYGFKFFKGKTIFLSSTITKFYLLINGILNSDIESYDILIWLLQG